MWNYPTHFDVIVIGAGHAGCEAALAAARVGVKTLLLTQNLDGIAKMSCNPSIGGVGKGQIVREIDALGGEMGKVADETALHWRMLNRSKGPAVWSPRAQIDKWAYSSRMKERLEQETALQLIQAETVNIEQQGDSLLQIETKEGVAFCSKTVVLSAGTFMKGLLHLGQQEREGGRLAEPACNGLSKSLKRLGINLGRLKTGTPPRILSHSIDFSRLEPQPSEKGIRFSFWPNNRDDNHSLPCHITYTNARTHEMIRENLERSALYSGKIEGTGPRYCPSIEDKIVRFADKERHQIFLEPEGFHTQEVYVNGLSTSLPFDVQYALLRTIEGLENATIARPAYAIEYDYVTCHQVSSALECRYVENLFFAGQINGTTGYEEAAAQGLIAGINAAKKSQGEGPFILSRHEGYIGVLIDDIVHKTLTEPYRMFTSRVESRLSMRQDNAHHRLSDYGVELGLLSADYREQVERERALIECEVQRLQRMYRQVNGKRVSLAQLLCRKGATYMELSQQFPSDFPNHGKEVNAIIYTEILYAGYLKRERKEKAQLAHLEKMALPRRLDYTALKSLSHEAKEKLSQFRPHHLGQAMRIDGVSPADISAIVVYLKSMQSRKEECALS